MLKKTMMLAMAVAAVAAVAVPGVASASNWKHHSQEFQGNRQIELTGQAKFLGGLGGVECQTTSKLTVVGLQTTGTVDEFKPDLDQAGSTVTSKCKGLGALAFCQIHQATALGLPWTVHNETQRVKITSGTIELTLEGGFCPARKGTVTPANGANSHTVYATPNQPHTVSSFQLSGEVEVHLYATHAAHAAGNPYISETAEVSGQQTILAPNANTYSLT